MSLLVGRAWRCLLGHIGVFGILWALFLGPLTWLIWATGAPRTMKVEMAVLVWLISYVACVKLRADREHHRRRTEANTRKAEAAVVLFRVWDKLDREDAETIRKGLL